MYQIDTSLVKRLITTQFPKWKDLHLEPVTDVGTDNTLYRLDEEMVVRLPRVDWAVGQVEKEYFWLSKLAPHLPLSIPTPIALGVPEEDYPYHWSVNRWLPGKNAINSHIRDLNKAAVALAEFIMALQRIDPNDGPAPGTHNSYRGVPLIERDAYVREAIRLLDRNIDVDAVESAWEEVLRAPEWQGPGVWIHGDIHEGNVLLNEGSISSVIDFGCLGVGDPACDMLPAWSILSSASR